MLGIVIIIIEPEGDQKKLIFVIIVVKRDIGQMNAVCLEKKGKYIFLIYYIFIL